MSQDATDPNGLAVRQPDVQRQARTDGQTSFCPKERTGYKSIYFLLASILLHFTPRRPVHGPLSFLFWRGNRSSIFHSLIGPTTHNSRALIK
jgi:hypothetical protein